MRRNDPAAESKPCSRCGHEWPNTSQFFKLDKRKFTGLSAQCRSCANAEGRKRDAERHDHKLARGADYYARNRAEVLTRQAAYRREHPEAVKAARDRYRRAHRDEVRARERQRYARDPAGAVARAMACRRSNPLPARAAAHRRRARILEVPGTHTAADIEAQYERQKRRCYWCGKSLGSEYHTDHVIPLVKGGSDGPENLVAACAHCNLSKGPKMPAEVFDRLC